jgi:benzoylformate decarboxylase
MGEPPPGRRGVDVLLDYLEANRFEFIFGNPGTLEQSFMAALAERPQLQYILGLHETVAVAMADGYSRASGGPAFVNVHISAGLANSLSQIYNANIHHSPLVITAGQSQSHMLISEPLLSADTVSLASQFTKWAWELRHPSDLLTALRRGFKIASSAPSGPVFLSLPLDVVDVLMPVQDLTKALVQSAWRSQPAPDDVGAAANIIRVSRHPVIVCGDAVGRSGAVHQIVQLAEIIGAEVFALGQCEMSFPNNHSQFIRTLNVNAPSARDHLEAADVIVAIGTPLLMQLVDPGAAVLPQKARIIHLDESGWEAGKNAPIEVALVGDLALAMDALRQALDSEMTADEKDSAATRRNSMQQKKDLQRGRLERRLADAELTGFITELNLMSALHKVVPLDSVIVEEAPTASSALHQVFAFSRPKSLFGNRGGALGWGLPAALGVQLAMPDQTVVAVVGDGSANYSIQALWTAARYRLPVKFVICNNRSYHVLKVNIGAYLPEVDLAGLVGMDLIDPPIDFASLARGYGVAARRVDNLAELNDAMLETMREPGPCLIDVSLSPPAE